jgi:membrane-associated phospholipid phosphatase
MIDGLFDAVLVVLVGLLVSAAFIVLGWYFLPKNRKARRRRKRRSRVDLFSTSRE